MGWGCGFALPNSSWELLSSWCTQQGRRGWAEEEPLPGCSSQPGRGRQLFNLQAGMPPCPCRFPYSHYFVSSPVPQPTPLMLFSLGSCTLPRSGLPPLSITSGPLNSARMWRRRLGAVADTCVSGGCGR